MNVETAMDRRSANEIRRNRPLPPPVVPGEVHRSPAVPVARRTPARTRTMDNFPILTRAKDRVVDSVDRDSVSALTRLASTR